MHGCFCGGGEVLVAAVVLFDHGGHDIVGATYGDPDSTYDDAAASAVGSAGACKSADGYGVVGVQQFVGADDHLAHHFLADGGLFGDDGRIYAEQFGGVFTEIFFLYSCDDSAGKEVTHERCCNGSPVG